MSEVLDKIDQFRFISQTHTTVRQLIICSRIIKLIGNKHLPLDFLQLNLINWSEYQETHSIAYTKSRGKITDKGKPTTSFRHYIKLVQELGLLANLNSILSLTRTASILISYIPEKVNFDFKLTQSEILFFCFFILKEDADAIITILQELKKVGDDKINQKDLLSRFL